MNNVERAIGEAKKVVGLYNTPCVQQAEMLEILDALGEALRPSDADKPSWQLQNRIAECESRLNALEVGKGERKDVQWIHVCQQCDSEWTSNVRHEPNCPRCNNLISEKPSQEKCVKDREWLEAKIQLIVEGDTCYQLNPESVTKIISIVRNDKEMVSVPRDVAIQFLDAYGWWDGEKIKSLCNALKQSLK